MISFFSFHQSKNTAAHTISKKKTATPPHAYAQRLSLFNTKKKDFHYFFIHS
jgi:hypothetical protein